MPAMFIRLLQIALVLAFLNPKTHAAPPVMDLLTKGAAVCSVMLYGLAFYELRQGDLARAAGNEAVEAGNLEVAHSFYEQAVTHHGRGFAASGVGAVTSISLVGLLYAQHEQIRGGYGCVRLTHIPDGVTLFEGGSLLDVQDGSAKIYGFSKTPKVIVAKRGDQIVPLSPGGQLNLVLVPGQHSRIRVDRLIANHATTSVE